MRPTQPPPANRRRRRRPDLSLPLPQRDPSVVVPMPLPPTSISAPTSSHQLSLYELDRVKRIGSGSSGTIYQVIHRPTKRLFALKVIHGNHHEDSVRRQILREFQILRDMNHPNVVKCHEIFDHEGVIQVLLEFMDGGSLQAIKTADEGQLSDFARQILSGLSYMHRRHIVHRDIKPSNILINSLKNVRIADFGVSRILEQTMDPCNSSAGTIAYLSPERINTDSNHGQCDGYAGDIWSFGVTILEFYLGRFPFAVGREGDWASLISVICMSQPPEAPPSASMEFRDFIACCLQRDPRRRWTAAQLLQHPFILRSNAGGGQVPSHVMPGISKHEEVPSTPQCAVSGMGQACSRVDVRWIYQILVRMPYKVEVSKMRDMLETMRHGDHAFRKLDFKTAIDCYSQFIDVAEVSPVIFARRSLCYLFCDQPDDALRDAMRAQFIYLEWPTAFYLQSAALAKLGMHKDASDLLNEAARLEETSQQEVLKGVSEVEKQSETYETRTDFMPQNQSGKAKISAVGGRGKPDMMQPQEEESDALHVGSAGNQMIPEASGQQGRKATSQGIETEIVQIQEMREQSFSSSALEQSDMPTEISLEATIQNGMINLSGGRCDIRIDRTLNTIVECIKSSDIGKIGVYGRAGVGKTTVLEALKDLPEIRSMFDRVIWVTIPKTWNPIEVQTLIARQISCSEIDDMHKDTARFVSLLEPIKFLLILDDVDEHINLEMAGIPKPTPENGSKIVLTTRWQQVCEIMAVDANIRLENLLSWELFCQSVGEVVDSFNIQPIAKQLVEMCCHYSHAIILMAGALKDVSDVDVWKNALEWLSLQPASYGENLENLLIDVLKFSCEHLADDTTKKCLRYCAQHCEKEEIAIESLIHQWIADGLVDTHLEGNRILQNLINANLLESVKGGVFVKLQSIDRHILVNSIIQPEEGKLFLMLGGLGLTELPKEEEWENAKEIHLMHNELCELPEILRCPMLSALFLQRNYKLRLIPPSFFDYMPVLQVLNLSSTRIRSLPESLFRLVSLKRFFLNDCRNFMMLSPKIGELKQLEVLDLEGTEIMDLPREMKNLTGLKCLEVSIYGHANDGRRVKQSNAMVHSGIISALSEVEELNIDVNPDDERWDACAEAIVNEVCSLMKLSILKFYFPRVELLSHFEWNSTSMVYPLLSNFRFIVGHHINRIMTRLPRDVEFELERWDRCLKYVNGVGIPGEIKKVLRHATAFHLDRHTSVKKLSDFGVENMEQLKCCVVGECNELQVFIDGGDFYEEDYSEEIVPESYGDRGIGLQSLEYLYLYYMKNLRSIWEGPLHQRCLILLKSLTLQTCPMLTTIFMQESLDNLCSLEELTVEDCPAIISLFSCENPSESKSYCDLPKLKKISVHYLPELASICDCPLIAPKLEWVSFYNCPKLNKLPIDEEFNENLKNIKSEWSWWNALEWRSGRPKFLDDIFIPIDVCD